MAEFLVDSPACVAQAVRTSLLLFQGEWFLDATAGMPWFQKVLGYGTKSLYDAAVKNCILGVQGVLSIVSYSSDLDESARRLSVTAAVNTIYGKAEITNVPLKLGGYGISPYAQATYNGA